MGKVIGSIVGVVTFIMLLVFLFTCVERIPAGYTGVCYSINGGVQETTLSQGWHIVSPTVKVYEFTVGNEQLLLTKDEREGSKEDESFKVATSENAKIGISFQMSYSYDPARVVDTFKKFKGMDGDDIVSTRLRTVLKSKISEVTTNYSLMDIYSGDLSKINNEITDYLNDEFYNSYGINVYDASIIDAHPDENLMASINARVQAQQAQAKARAEQETIKVQAETAIIEAQKDADVAKIKAENEAEIKRISAEAEAEANKTINASLTKNLISKYWIERWNGVLPTYSGDGSESMMFNVE